MIQIPVAMIALALAVAQPAAAQELAPIAYVIRIPAPATHEIVVQATVPTSGQPSLDLMMPTWSPGYYRVEDYAANVRDVTAQTHDGQPLIVEKTNANHWRVVTRGTSAVRLSYRVYCKQRTVTTNEHLAGVTGPPDAVGGARGRRRSAPVVQERGLIDRRTRSPTCWSGMACGSCEPAPSLGRDARTPSGSDDGATGTSGEMAGEVTRTHLTG